MNCNDSDAAVYMCVSAGDTVAVTVCSGAWISVALDTLRAAHFEPKLTSPYMVMHDMSVPRILAYVAVQLQSASWL